VRTSRTVRANYTDKTRQDKIARSSGTPGVAKNLTSAVNDSPPGTSSAPLFTARGLP
jgi:hypothetical protein